MSQYDYAWEKLHLSVESFRNPGNRKEQLLDVMVSHLSSLQSKQLPPSVRKKYDELRNAAGKIPTIGQVEGYRVNIDSWSDAKVLQAIQLIIQFYNIVCCSFDEYLGESLRVLQYHCLLKKGDLTWINTFNRLLVKSIRPPGWKEGDHMDIQLDQIRSHQERRTTGELAQFPRTHDRDEPICKYCPIVVAVYEGQERLLDGTTRINYWLKEGNTDLHHVNVNVIEQSYPESR